MRKNSPSRIMMGLAALVVVGGGGFWLYNWVLGPTLAPSGPVRAMPLAAPPPKALDQYQIVQNGSTAQFEIYEELRGKPTHVVGTTNQVAGEAAINPSDLSSAELGEIRVDARALATDNDHRNQAIRNRILSTDQYEYVTFKPKKITGLTGAATQGSTHAFQIEGDLTVRDVTKPVVFVGALTVGADKGLSATAKTTVKRGDFGLVIPNLPFLANVGEDVVLKIDAALAPMKAN